MQQYYGNPAYRAEQTRNQRSAYNRRYGIGDDLEGTKYEGNPSYFSERLGANITMSPKELERFRTEELNNLMERNRYTDQLGQLRDERERDLGAGRSFFDRLYNTEGASGSSLGSSAFGSVRQDRSSELADLLAKRQGAVESTADIANALERRREALGGLDSTEGNALREASLRGLLSQQKSSARDLRGSLGGLRGGAAAAAQADLANQAEIQRSQMEQDLLLRNIDIQNQALGAYEQSAYAEDQRRRAALGELEGTLTRAEQDELLRQQYNQAQAARELAARGGAELGFANLGQAERNQIFGQIAAENQADATRNSGGGGVCFITTAVSDYLGIPDDENNNLLNVFRKFRDEHMGGKESDLVKEYYRIAPLMKDQLKDDFEELHNIAVKELLPAFYAIRTANPEEAKDIYMAMVTRLAAKYEIGLEW